MMSMSAQRSGNEPFVVLNYNFSIDDSILVSLHNGYFEVDDIASLDKELHRNMLQIKD